MPSFDQIVQAVSSIELAEIMANAFGRLFNFGDSIYFISQKAAFYILVAALIVQGWRGRTAQDITIWLWVMLSLLIACIVTAQWLNLTRPPDGIAWQFGQSFANAVGDTNPSSLSTFWDRVLTGFPEPSWKDFALILKINSIALCITISSIITFFMRLIQMAMIAILYSLGPIFIAFICINVLRSPGVRYMFTLASMYTWDLAWKFVDAGSETLMAFGSSTGDGVNPLMIVVALIWAILAPIFMPIFLSRLFVAGASGIADSAQGFALGRASAVAKAGAKDPVGTLSSIGKVAMASTGVPAAMAIGQTAFSAMKGAAGKITGMVRQAAAGADGGGAESAASPSASAPASVTGSLKSGESMQVAGASAAVKRNDDNNFSIGKQSFTGNPNNPQTLFDALTKTSLSHVDQANIRNAMKERQPQPA